MEQRTVTAVTAKMTTAQSRIRSELGNFPSGPTKFTVVHRRPVFFVPPQQQQSPQPTSGASVLLANAMCRFAHHPVAGTAQKSTAPECSRMSSAANATTTTTSSSGSVLVSSQQQTNGIGKRAAADAVARQNSGSDIVKPAAARIKPILKRSLSADHLDSFQPVPAKRPFPVQIWFNNPPRGPRPLVATAFWLDSPLHDSQAFVYIKLLEASQARRYLQLQSKPRKYLHLTSGWIVVINNPPAASRKPELMLPPMTVKLMPAQVKPVISTAAAQRPLPQQIAAKTAQQPVLVGKSAQPTPQNQPFKKSSSSQLPPPPPLISLRPQSQSAQPQQPTIPKREIESPPPLQEHPLELCNNKRSRKQSTDDCDSPPDSPRLVINHSAPSSPLNLAMNGLNNSSIPATSNNNNNSPAIAAAATTTKRKISLPTPFTLTENNRSQNEPLDLASPSPTAVFNRMTLTDILSPASPATENFRRRLILVLQVLLGKRRLLNLGHPEASVEEILARILKKADVVPAKSSDVRLNWLKFLRLCVKNEDAWKREGWDRKSPDAILDEIYLQETSMTNKIHCGFHADVIPILRKSEPSRRINEYLQQVDAEKNVT
ncbi:formin-like protein 20 isoform X1 [Daphnia pulex]|uniref:formin-like protein 20 isoform X1 n=1 Tax=Daphnia pulex TaxID=6669 RepID=UPI001EDE5322|nr:formin-like protein 20 isoform X1 [Daphnia pulex]XP_046445416.1 formin-like protein 20 isoform X1 [Daphnia pulex]